MILRLVRNRIFTSMLALGVVGATLGMDARSASAQSITVTTSFPFCVNNQAFPRGTYRFTPLSQWILSIRDVNGENEELFPVRPEFSNREGSQIDPMWNAGGVTFRTSDGVRTLQAVYDPISDRNLVFPVQHSRNQHHCAAQDYIARSRSGEK
jgi:hypothetical protein